MMKRAEKMFDFNKLTFSLCSIEDVFVLKTMTEREGDLEDCFSLAKKGVDWKVILKEINKQIKISNQKVWITQIGERLDLLEEKGLIVPIMSEIYWLREEYFTELEKKLNKSRTG